MSKAKKTAYLYDLQGQPAGSVEIADGDDLPSDSTLVAPPELDAGFYCVYNGDDWTICKR